jgi:NADPH-dependent curcumin reductase CurA
LPLVGTVVWIAIEVTEALSIINRTSVAEVAMEHHGGFEAGDVVIRERSWETFSFAIHHLHELIDGLHAQYFRDDHAKVGPEFDSETGI